MRVPLLKRLLTLWTLLALLATPAAATWSIVTINLRTGEVGVASATCLERFNLRKWTPVIRVGVGAGAAQSSIDSGAVNRKVIRNGLVQGLDAEEILVLLESDPGFEGRQYGIVAFGGPPVTFTGQNAGPHASGVTGQVDDYVYAIQGNVLTGRAVVTAAEEAFRDTDGDMGQRLMAAMEAAYVYGGDGRCSCSQNRPTQCGAPPPSFTKTAHCAYLLVARIGDPDGLCNASKGCATAQYHLTINVAGNDAAASAPDPVLTMRQRYDNWRRARLGRPDGLRSSVDPVPALPADGKTTRTVTVRLVDLDGVPLTSGGTTVTVDPVGASSRTSVGPVLDNGDGTYSFELTAGDEPGTDRFAIVAEDAKVRATLYPYLEVRTDALQPLHAGLEEVSLSAGGRVPLTLNVDQRPRGRYLVLGSLSGTDPGFTLGKLAVPLNPDAMTLATLVHAGDPDLLPGTVGFLDQDGHAEGAVVVGPGQLATAGLRFDWVGLVVGRGKPLATNAVGFEVLP